jgi:hypothetical protein
MAKREISHLDLKIKLLKESLENGGMEKIVFPEILEDLGKIKVDANGKVDPETVSAVVNAMMTAMLQSELSPPPFHPEYISEYSTTLQKSFSFDYENIDTVEQFDKIYDEYKEKADTIFRGQREAKWRLYNKLQRHWIAEKLSEKEESYKKLIENLVENGKADFGAQIKELLNFHNIDNENSISILGYLQHHGCPTPLLDWTYKFQNALFFALENLVPNPGTIEIEDYFSVYYIEEKYVEGSNMRTIMEQALSSLEKDMLQKTIKVVSKNAKQRKKMEKHFAGRQMLDRKKIFGSGLITHMTKIEHLMGFPLGYFSDRDTEMGVLFSLNNSKNILNQEGVFVWNPDPSKPVEMVGNEWYKADNDGKDSDYRFCMSFNIHKNLAEHARNRLEADGITKEFIYPTPEINTWETFEKSKKNIK